MLFGEVFSMGRLFGVTTEGAEYPMEAPDSIFKEVSLPKTLVFNHFSQGNGVYKRERENVSISKKL